MTIKLFISGFAFGLGILILFAGISVLAEVVFFADDEGYYIQVDTIFSEDINNFILNDPRVSSIEFLNNETTIIKLVDEDAYYQLYNGNIINYLKTLESQNEWNKEHLTIYPDLQPAPLCLRDTNGNINSIYSVNNELFLNVNDVRCPQDE